MVSSLVHVCVYSAVTCRHFHELRCLLHHHATLILCKCSCSNWVCMLYFHNHFYSMYEVCCMFMLSSSSPYVHGLSILYILLGRPFWPLSASIHVDHFACYVHAWPRQSSILGLCSHALPYSHTFAYLMQLTFNLFLSAYTVRPADQSAIVLPAVIGTVGGVIIIAAISGITLALVCIWIGKS